MPETFVTHGDSPEMRVTRLCQYCGSPAEIHDIDGAWCSPEHRTYDRQNETTIRRRAER